MLIIEAGLHHNAVLVITVVVLVSLLTFVPLIRIWSEAFWKAKPTTNEHPQSNPALTFVKPNQYLWVPVLGLSLVMLLIGLLPGGIIAMSDTAAQNLVNPSAYLSSVLREVQN